MDEKGMQQHGQECLKCESSDAMSIYEDGTAYCFSCKSYFHKDQVDDYADGDKNKQASESRSKPLNSEASYPTGISENVPQRGIQKVSAAYYGTTVGFDEQTGEVRYINFPVYCGGELVGEKEKDLQTGKYVARGSTKNPDFFGANKAGSGGKLLIVTEGEVDAISVHQMLAEQGKQYNVVSLPNGANPSAVRKHIEWLESFETIILNMDNDTIGIAASKEIADILTPGKVKIMRLPCKDANEFLLKYKNSKEYLKLVYNAKPYRPDGVVALSESWDSMWATDHQRSILYPWDGLNNKLYGLRNREIITFTAGTGVGKSAVIRELEHWLLTQTLDNIGILALEESVSRTAWGVVSVEANLPLSIREERAQVTQDDVKPWFQNTLGTGRLFTLDHFGSTSEQNLLSQVRYMVKGLQCKWVFLDHLSIVVSAMNDMGDERKAIDSIMTKLRQLVEETEVGLLLVSHLRRIDGNRGHEQGVEVSLSHLRGSQAIAQLSDSVVALERNQQAEDDLEANLTTVRVLKNRYAGLTGIATHLAYDRTTGRLTEIKNINEYLVPDGDI